MSAKFETPKLNELTPTNLNEYAILIAFHKKSWTPSARDARMEENTKEREGYLGEARLYKQLVAKSWLEDFRANARLARKFHDDNTLPWADLGYRILVAANYQHYIENMSEFVMNSKRLVEELKAKWPDALAEARALWPGDTFNSDDYPTVEEIDKLFLIDWTERPVPNSDDFRLQDINPAMQRRMQEKLDADLSDAITEAIAAPWESVFRAVKRMVETLSDPKKSFEFTMISNLADVAAALPGLNITNDPKLTEVSDDVKELLAALDPDLDSTDTDDMKDAAKEASAAIRKDEAFRAEAAKKAQKALDKMSGFMGGAS